MMWPVTPWRRLASLVALLGVLAAAPSSAATWEDDLTAVITQTDRVMTLSPEELQRLVAECDRLRPLIEALPETPRKVYRRRLEMTRNLFLFTLDAKGKPAGTLPADAR